MKTAFIILMIGMYVCVCFAVTQSVVQDALQDGATTRDAVTRACGAGGDCGACHGMIATMIEEHLEDRALADSVAASCPEPAASCEQLIPEAALVRTRAA